MKVSIAFGFCCIITYFISKYILSKTGLHSNLLAALIIYFFIIISILSALAFSVFALFRSSDSVKYFITSLIIVGFLFSYVYLKNTDIISIPMVATSKSIVINNSPKPMTYDAYKKMQKQNNQTTMQNANIVGIICTILFIVFFGIKIVNNIL